MKSKPIQRKKVNTKMIARMLQYKGGLLSFHSNRTRCPPGKIPPPNALTLTSERAAVHRDKRPVINNRSYLIAAVFFATVALVSLIAEAAAVKAPKGYVLVWSDEFNSKNGSLPDASKWTYDIGGNGWGNHELEYYTNRRENARMPTRPLTAAPSPGSSGINQM